MKTDRCDADQLARLQRAGELTPIHIPDQEDLARERERCAPAAGKDAQGRRSGWRKT